MRKAIGNGRQGDRSDNTIRTGIENCYEVGILNRSQYRLLLAAIEAWGEDIKNCKISPSMIPGKDGLYYEWVIKIEKKVPHNPDYNDVLQSLHP